MDCRPGRLVIWWVAALLAGLGDARAQEPPSGPLRSGDITAPAETQPDAAETREVGVRPLAADEEIARRLQEILRATGWFVEPRVEVQEGVAFIWGRARTAEQREWATRLGQRTEDVVAVVNHIELIERPIWDVSPALVELRAFWRQLVQMTPLLGFGLLLLAMTWLVAGLVARLFAGILTRRVENDLLVDVTRKVVFVIFLLMGLFLMLRVSGLSRMALTLAGGTGIAGLVLGIAFRDIAENFLASMLISLQRPFRTGDLIELEGHLGYVQKVTTRGTLLMDLDGNYIQIPNSTVYKSTIRNFTANPSQRLDFIIGIGYDTPISRAQEIVLGVARAHPAVLADPEPMALVDQLGSSAVSLRIYFWVDNTAHSVLRVKSAMMRLTLRAFQEAEISLPDEAREIIFPESVPVRMIGAGEPTPGPAQRRGARGVLDSADASTAAEGKLTSEAGQIQSQALRSRLPEEGRNLLDDDR